MSKRRSWYRFLGNVALGFATLAALFVLAESIARVLYHPENLGRVIQFDDRLGWSLKPRARVRSVDSQRDLDYQIAINPLGMREREFPIEKTKGKKRILIIGDSVVFGTGVDARWRFSDFMGRALEDEVEVLNAGVTGWGTDQELLFYESTRRRLKPDVVILTMTLANDVMNNMLDHQFLGSAPKPRFTIRGDSLVLEREIVERPKRSLGHVSRELLRKSRFLLFVKRRLDSLKHEQGPAPAPELHTSGFRAKELENSYSFWTVFEKSSRPDFERAWRVTEALLVRFSEVCRADGAEFIVFAFPGKLEIDVEWRERLLEHTGIDENRLDFDRPYTRLARFCSRKRLSYIYPIEEFRAAKKARRLNHKKDAHPNAFGHALAARVLLEVLNEKCGFEYELAESDMRFYRGVPPR